MDKIKHMLILVDKEPLEPRKDFIARVLDDLEHDEGISYRHYVDQQTKIATVVVGEDFDFDRQSLLVACFIEAWGSELDSKHEANWSRQRFFAPNLSGAVVVEWSGA